MGTKWSEGRWVRQACIGWSVILNYQVCHDKTSGGCYIPTVPTHCPRLTANVTARLSPPIGRMDDTMCGRHGGVCVWGAEGRADTRAGGLVSLQSRSSLPQHCPPLARRRLTGPGARTDGGPVRGGAGWSPAFNCARRRRCCSSTNSSTL